MRLGAGETFEKILVSDNDIEVQKLIDGYNPLPEAKEEAKLRIKQEIEDHFNSIKAKYPSIELERFAIIELEYEKYQADNSASIPTITAIAASRGVTVAQQLSEIGQKLNAYKNLVNTAIGKRDKLFDQIDSETNFQNLDNIKYEG